MRCLVLPILLLALSGCKTAPTTAWNRVPPPEVIEVCRTDAEIFGQLLVRQIPPLQIQNTLQYRVVERVSVNGQLEQCSGNDCIVSISSTDASVIKKQLELSSSAVYTSMFLEGEISSCGASRCSVDLTESMNSYAQRSYAAIGQNIGDAYAQAGENIANAIRRSMFKAEVKDLMNKRMRQCLKIAGYYQFEIEKNLDYLDAEGASITISRVRATTSQDRINLSFEGRKVRACDEQLSRELFALADTAYEVFQLAQADHLKGVTSWINSNKDSTDNFASYLIYLDAKDRLKEANDPRRKSARRQCDFDLDDLPAKP